VLVGGVRRIGALRRRKVVNLGELGMGEGYIKRGNKMERRDVPGWLCSYVGVFPSIFPVWPRYIVRVISLARQQPFGNDLFA
jgi:hypothetical protein